MIAAADISSAAAVVSGAAVRGDTRQAGAVRHVQIVRLSPGERPGWRGAKWSRKRKDLLSLSRAESLNASPCLPFPPLFQGESEQKGIPSVDSKSFGPINSYWVSFDPL